MSIKHFTILMLLTFTTIVSAQVKVVDIPEVPQKNGIRFDRFGSSQYFACYTAGKNSFLSIYDADLKSTGKYQFPAEPVNISSPMYASSNQLLCLAFYRYTGKAGMEATLYTFNTKGELQGMKELKGSTIMNIVVFKDKVSVVTNNMIKETMTVLVFDHSLNQTWFTSIPFPESDLDEVRSFVPDNNSLFITVAYSQNDGKAIKIFGLSMNDGNQFLTYSKRTEEQYYYFNSCGKSGDNYYFIGENASSSFLSGNGVGGSGIFKLIINNKGERIDFTFKTWLMLIPEMQGTSGRTNVFSAISGKTFSIGLDKVINRSDGFIFVCHDHDKFRAVYTDASLATQKTVDLRQLESDKGEYLYEYLFCNGSESGSYGMIYMADDVDGVPAVFTNDLSDRPTGGKEVIKIDGSNHGPVFNSASEAIERDYTNNLSATNPSIISLSCDRIILFEDYNAEKDGARIYLYLLK